MTKAVVIGISSYPALRSGVLAAGDVPGAAEDAVAFHDWLTADRGLAEDDVSLHLSPASAHPRALPATRAAIRGALRDLRESAASGGSRFFFFFSGHGFSFQQSFNGELEDLIACQEFETPKDLDPTIRTGEILEWLRRMGPSEQFFFFDCCRNSLVSSPLQGGQLGLNAEPDPSLSDSTQLALFAARPGETTRAPSPFTAALLAGLRGTGSARVWSRGSLVVTFDSLSLYLREKLAAAPSPLRRGASPGVLLTVFRPGQGAPPTEPCEILVDRVSPSDRLVARAYLEETPISAQELPGGRGTLRLTPRTYTVTLESPDGAYSVVPPSALVDVFEPSVVRAQARPASLRFGGFPKSLRPDLLSADPSRSEGLPARAPRKARLILRVPAGASADVLGSDGEHRLGVPEGTTTLDADVPAGHYTIRLWQAERVVREIPAALLPGDRFSLDLGEPPADPLRRDLAACTGGGVFLPAESLGPIHDPRLSLWIAAVAVQAASGRPHAPLAAAPVPRPGATEGSLFLAIATEAPRRARLWTPAGSSDIALVAAGGVTHLHHAASAAPPGVHVLGWETAHGRFSMVMPVLPRRVTTLAIVDVENEPRSAQLFLTAHRDEAHALPPEERPTASQVLAARSLVNAQEAFARGEPPGAFDAPWIDPLWVLLSAYAALREARPAHARAHLGELRARWPALPDIEVLGCLLGSAASPIRGLPLVADGGRAVARWGATGNLPLLGALAGDAHGRALAGIVPGAAWTTWAGWPYDTAPAG